MRQLNVLRETIVGGTEKGAVVECVSILYILF